MGDNNEIQNKKHGDLNRSNVNLTLFSDVSYHFTVFFSSLLSIFSN